MSLLNPTYFINSFLSFYLLFTIILIITSSILLPLIYRKNISRNFIIKI